jgi:hypothetical protein
MLLKAVNGKHLLWRFDNEESVKEAIVKAVIILLLKNKLKQL